MRAAPDGLDAQAVVEALREGWDVDAAGAEYAPVGGGSYHWRVAGGFVTVDDLGQKAWLGDTHDAAFDGLRAAFDAAVALRNTGLDFVVAPIRSRDGASLRRIDARYSIALFPLVEGEAGEFGYFEEDEEGRRAVVEMLARLHGCTARWPRPRHARRASTCPAAATSRARSATSPSRGRAARCRSRRARRSAGRRSCWPS
jgi:spectinomycin phosphotransferase